MAQIFISYAREDFKPVSELRQRLKDEGFTTWMDKVDLLAGQRWRPAIEQAVRESDFFVLCLSNRTVSKRSFVQREIKMALDLWQEMLADDIFLIPVLLEHIQPEEIPVSIREIGWVFLFEEDGWDDLMRALKHGIKQRSIDTARKLKREEEERLAEEARLSAAVEAQRVHEETVRRQKEEAEQQERKAAEQKQKIEADRLQKEKEETARKLREEVERKQKEDAERKLRERETEERRREEEARKRKPPLPIPPPQWRSRKLPVILFGAMLLTALIGYWLWSASRSGNNNLAKQTVPPTPSPIQTSVPTNNDEVLRYSLEIEGEQARATSLSLDSGKNWRLHFTPQTDGYLYLLAPNKNGKLQTFLSAQPVKSGVEFPFPGGDDWIIPEKNSKQVPITIVFSAEPIKRLGFLAKNAGVTLTTDQREAFLLFRESATKASLNPSSAGNSPSVIAKAVTANGQPVVFDIVFEN